MGDRFIYEVPFMNNLLDKSYETVFLKIKDFLNVWFRDSITID